MHQGQDGRRERFHATTQHDGLRRVVTTMEEAGRFDAATGMVYLYHDLVRATYSSYDDIAAV